MTNISEGASRLDLHLPDPLLTRLQESAMTNRRSMNNEAIILIERSLSAVRPADYPHRLPFTFPNSAMIAWSRSQCPGLDVRAETRKFVAFWMERPNAVKSDWYATWRSWMKAAREAQDSPSLSSAE